MPLVRPPASSIPRQHADTYCRVVGACYVHQRLRATRPGNLGTIAVDCASINRCLTRESVPSKRRIPIISLYPQPIGVAPALSWSLKTDSCSCVIIFSTRSHTQTCMALQYQLCSCLHSHLSPCEHYYLVKNIRLILRSLALH